MKKNSIFKRIFAFILCVVSFAGMSKVNALGDVAYFTEKTTFNNRSQIILSYYDKEAKVDRELGSTYKKASLDGKTIYAFCFNHADDAPPTTPGSNELRKRQLKACEQEKIYNFAYVLENGLGGKWSLGGDFTEHEKYYITQLAIWFVQGSACDGVDIESVENTLCKNCNKTGRKGQIFEAAKTLYKNAINVQAPAKGSLKIEPLVSEMQASADKKYYRTGDYTVAGSGFTTYKVQVKNLPAGGKIVNSTTNAELDSGSSIQAGQKFYIKIPADKVTTAGAINPVITVTAGSTYKQLAVFEAVNKSKPFQNIGIAYGEMLPLTTEAKAVLKPTGGLQIIKKEKTETGEIRDLKDVTITVTNTKDSSISYTWNTSKNNPMVLDNLPTGQYRIVEVKAPEGIIKAEDQIVTVKPLEITTVELMNYRTEKVTVSKQDATTGAELPGATIQLQDPNGNVLEEWQSTNTPHVIEKSLTDYPEYCLVETIAPKGYQKKTTKQCFKVNSKGGVDTPVVMKNEPETTVKISKVDATSGNELPGAKLIIKEKETGNIVDEWISTTKPHYVTLEPGKYILIETTPPNGYDISEEFIDFEVTNDGVAQTIVMKNSKIPETADIPVIYVAIGLCAAILIAGFGMFKLSKQEEA